MSQLIKQTLTAFAQYGSVEHCRSKVRCARKDEQNYIINGLYSDPIDLTVESCDGDESEDDDAKLDDEISFRDDDEADLPE